MLDVPDHVCMLVRLSLVPGSVKLCSCVSIEGSVDIEEEADKLGRKEPYSF